MISMRVHIGFVVFAVIGGFHGALAQDVPPPPTKDLKSIRYSPYPAQDFPNQVFYGDTHLHTSYSTDAGMGGCTLGPEDAYRFAMGATVKSSTGVPARLSRSLDFLVIADHAENLGLAPAIAVSDQELLKNAWGKMLHDLARSGRDGGIEAYDKWLHQMNIRENPLAGSGLGKTYWHKLVDAAEKYNQPGQFTALIGFEWTAMPKGNNLHRNVVFRDGGDKAKQIIPISQYETNDPEKLWQWMADYEQKTGGRLLAIPHNGNISNGLMFDVETFTGGPITKEYAEQRMKWEPIYEITQMKGTGEAHPLLSRDDEFADFELWDKGSFGPQPKTAEMLPREYAREALKQGLAYEQSLGVNPFKFGVIGSTDAHTGLASTEENNYFGKVTPLEPSADPIRFEETIVGRSAPAGSQTFSAEVSSGGLAAVWARENTREAIWDAFARKEVFATTGTRLRVRVFGGFGFQADDLARSNFPEYGYQQGVPMGGDLRTAPTGKSPAFLVRAIRDADGANLDRVQIIKGWLDAQGQTQERIWDVAVSGKRQIGENGRCVTPVGNTVNVPEATYTNGIGAPALEAYWQDPAFDPKQRAFYYVRVIEIPTPRWTTYDAKIFGVTLPEGVPSSIQERAFTSPIWYTP